MDHVYVSNMIHYLYVLGKRYKLGIAYLGYNV